MAEHTHDHEVLYAHCGQCKSDSMKIQFSEEHGMVIACKECETVVLHAQNGEHLDAVLRRVSKDGCAHTEDHKHEKIN